MKTNISKPPPPDDWVNPYCNPKTPPAQAARVVKIIQTGSLITTSDRQGIGLLTGRNHKPTPRPHLMKALTSSRAGRRRNPTSSLYDPAGSIPFSEWDGEEGPRP